MEQNNINQESLRGSNPSLNIGANNSVERPAPNISAAHNLAVNVNPAPSLSQQPSFLGKQDNQDTIMGDNEMDPLLRLDSGKPNMIMGAHNHL